MESKGRSNMTGPELSILSKASTSDLVLEPYPHLVIKNALDPSLFEELQNTLPPAELILEGKKKRDTWFDYPACKVIKNPNISLLWKQFFAYHTSDTFLHELLSLYGGQLKTLHPHLENMMGKKLEDAIVKMRPGGRSDRLADGADISMECQFYINYTESYRSIRGSHIDRPSELFAALLYFRQPEDNSTGGDLHVNTAQNPEKLYPKERTISVDKLPMEISENKVSNAAIGHYEANTLVLFLNSHKSIHAVSPRSATLVPRRHINFCCDLNFDLFEIKRPARLALKHRLEQIPVLWRISKWI